MSKHLPWYKRDVALWRDGTRRMSFELRGFYSAILDAMWDLQGQIPKDPAKLAVMLDGNPRSIRKLLPQLIAAGKLVETAIGYYNPRMLADILSVQEVPVDGEFAPNSTPIQREFDGNSAGIQREFPAKVPKKPMISTRDLEVDTDTDTESVCEARARETDLHKQGSLTVTPTAISHRGFTISLPAIEMGLAGRLPRAEVARHCQAHALQWAAEIDAGKLPQSVVPQKIANFLVASIMGELNRAATAEVRASRGAAGDGPRPMLAPISPERKARILAMARGTA